MRHSLTALTLFILLSGQHTLAQDFCANLPKILNEVGFEESFLTIRGDSREKFERKMGEETVYTNYYTPTQELIPGVPSSVVHTDYEGGFDSWKYLIDYSTSSSLDDQRKIATYWQETIKKCMEGEEGWSFSLVKRGYSSESNMEVWSASKTMDGYLGLRVVNVLVILYEEFDAHFKATGRYGVRIEVM
jgi:hypothetical protein